MKQWILLGCKGNFAEEAKELNIDPVCVRIMGNRGMTTLKEMKEFLETDISKCSSYDGLPDIDKAVKTIKDAKEKGLKCRVIGDYDADGVCSAAILVKGLSLFGLQTDYSIPNRLLDGYGLNINLVDKAYEDKIGIIVTCDNGISAREAIDYASGLGIKTVVTDHHTVTLSELPTKADAMVNPKLDDSTYPFSDICGAMVAYKLLNALFGDMKAFENVKEELLELSAIATVTDVMPLKNENRDAVKWILERLKNPKNMGLSKLVEGCNINQKQGRCSSSDIGFQIGPCINATGRIDVADRAVNLFVSDDEKECGNIVGELIKLNAERKELTVECVGQAAHILDKQVSDNVYPEACVVLYLPECHASICGLVAGRIRERYYRPTFVFTDSKDGLTGSGRSIDEFDMIKAVQECSDLLTKFGGHKMACGLSIPKENLDAFRKKINAISGLDVQNLFEKVRIDANMPFGYVTPKVIEDISKLEPFGTGNPTPVFALKNLRILNGRKFGEGRNHLLLNVSDNSGLTRTLKLWREADAFDEFLIQNTSKDVTENFYSSEGIGDLNLRITVSYFPSINEFNNRIGIDFKMTDYKMS